MCEKCPTFDCHEKMVIEEEKCGKGGYILTKTFGQTWYCSNNNCKGEMKEMVGKPGYYECIDTKCWGTGKLDEKYKCQDPTCPAMGGKMVWSSDIKAWSCYGTGCDHCDARAVQKSDGWVCESPSCPGKMVKPSGENYYDCVDPNCKGKIITIFKDNETQYYCTGSNTFILIIGGILLAMVIGIVVIKKKQKKLEEDLKEGQGKSSFASDY